MERPTVLLAIDGEAESHLEALERAGFAPTLAVVAALPAGPFDLGVIDCDLGTDVAISVYAALQTHATVPVLLMLGDGMNVPIGLGTKADELALKPLLPDALVYRLQALLIRGGHRLPTESGEWAADETLSTAPVAGEGHAVSVFAPKGGVGKTTISVNVAVALRQQTRAEVLLFDADVGVGNVTSVLDVPFRLGLADLADSPSDDWTDAAFEQCVTTHAASGVRVMTWGTNPAESERISVDLLLAAMRWAKQHYSYIIVDTHPGYDDRTMAMLTVANEIFLVVTPEVGAIRNSSQFLELARSLGLGSVVRVIVNRANHGIQVDDMSTSLGLPISATVVSNGPKAVIASNEGLPLVTKYPKERISDDLHRVARLISAPDAQPVSHAPAPVRRWLGRLGERTSPA
ncbi:MAG: AAA family ATPase [Chloroflexota bacterium]|nr:AAA family ATPase [Chloroflexota bacterium]